MTMTAPRTVSTHSDCICGGAGTVFVDEDYVQRQAHRYLRGEGGALEPGILDALRWSVIPCYECRPTQYRLWAEGHYAKDHRPCATCRPKRQQSSGRKRSAQ